MERKLLSRLVIPLTTLSAISVLIHLKWSAGGFFINLATELVGILITVCYVDWILKQHELNRWLVADERVANRLRILINSVIASIRSSLGVPANVLDERISASGDMLAMHNEVLRVGEHVVSPMLRSLIERLDQPGWRTHAQDIQSSLQDVNRFLTLFQSRLSPPQIAHFLDLEDALGGSLAFYATFPDIMGVPKDRLPKTKSPPEELQAYGCKNAAEKLETSIKLLRCLSDSVAEVI